MPQSSQFTLKIDGGSEHDIEELAALTQRLRTELLYLDVDDVELITSGPAPAGSKAGDAITWGSLLVTLGASGVLPAVIGTIQSWMARNDQKSVTMEIDGEKISITGVSSEQQQALIQSWMNRHQLAEG